VSAVDSKAAHASADAGTKSADSALPAPAYDHEFDMPPDQKPCCLWWDNVEVGKRSTSQHGRPALPFACKLTLWPTGIILLCICSPGY
jgi:hypothetical protein